VTTNKINEELANDQCLESLGFFFLNFKFLFLIFYFLNGIMQLEISNFQHLGH
jgi:hypothetical protein